tara:strand:+ start:30714 stop:31487 length:774 start_codon:yes stop_codon:yes gene_type:complete
MSKFATFVFVSDTHGDMIDLAAEAKFFEWVSDFSPQHRIHGGDFVDLRPIRKGASTEEKAECMEDDFIAAQKFLERYKPDTVLLGNHDARLWEALDSNNGMIASYAQRLLGLLQGDKFSREPVIKKGSVFHNCGVKRVLPYDVRRGVYTLGSLNMLHGFSCGMYPARPLVDAYGPNAICGHVHRFNHYRSRTHRGGQGMTAPCMCKLDAPYASRNIATLAWENGWIYGVVNTRTGHVEFWSVREQGGVWLDPRLSWL